MADIRVMGTKEVCDIVLDKISDMFKIISASEFYPNRGNKMEGRIYIKVDIEVEKINDNQIDKF